MRAGVAPARQHARIGAHREQRDSRGAARRWPRAHGRCRVRSLVGRVRARRPVAARPGLCIPEAFARAACCPSCRPAAFGGHVRAGRACWPVRALALSAWMTNLRGRCCGLAAAARLACFAVRAGCARLRALRVCRRRGGARQRRSGLGLRLAAGPLGHACQVGDPLAAPRGWRARAAAARWARSAIAGRRRRAARAGGRLGVYGGHGGGGGRREGLALRAQRRVLRQACNVALLGRRPVQRRLARSG